jgi:DNA-directed RNA polymerase specialized sigma24 family protein
MTAKDELNAIRAEDRAIQKELERIDAWYDFATRATGSMEAERISGTGERSRVETAVCRIVDFEREQNLTARIDALVDMRQSAERIIKRIDSPRFRQVLTLRYLQVESWTWGWRRIASVMGLPLTTVYELHGRALQAFANAQQTPPNAF